MAFLEQFSADERNLLVSLPYRAGLWVSAADDSGGGAAGERERAALEEIIGEKARGMFESAFVHEIMAETCTRRDDWSVWADALDSVPHDCEKAVRLVTGKLARRDLDAYRHNVMHIAVNVAKAFREFDLNEPFLSRLWAHIRLGLDKMVGMARGEVYESEALLNVSYEEDLVLAKLSAALGVGAQDETVAQELSGTGA